MRRLDDLLTCVRVYTSLFSINQKTCFHCGVHLQPQVVTLLVDKGIKECLLQLKAQGYSAHELHM